MAEYSDKDIQEEEGDDADPKLLKAAATTTVDIPFRLPDRLFGSSSNTHGKRTRIRLKCIDCHAGGEPARIVLSGVPTLPTNCTTALSKRSYMMDHLDHLRKILLLEPRGYPCQNVNFVFPPTGSNGCYQYVIGEQRKIYPLMSGHNTICVATALLECGVIPMDEPLSEFVLEAPSGPIAITANCGEGKAQSIAFENPPSFVEHLGVPVILPNHKGINIDNSSDELVVTVDVAYGGMWYCIVDLHQFRTTPTTTTIPEHQHKSSSSLAKLRLDPACGKELCRIGEMIKVACREQYPVQHPTEDYPGCDILAFRDTGNTTNINSNVVIMSNTVLEWDKPETWTAMIDRSPCGTGTCAIMATLYAKGLLEVGEPFDHYGIVGSKFTGTILGTTTLPDGRTAILPRIEGSACITQYSEVVVDAKFDPFPEGYKVADIW